MPAVVMVIEDDDDIRLSLVELLASWELVVLPARDGETALRMLREGHKPAVILLDLMMPGMSGWDFRRILMTDSSFARIPIVVMTALSVEPETAKKRMGDVIWLSKPFDPKVLATAITQARRQMAPDPAAVPVGHEPR